MSSADKRSVHTDALATLGTIIDEHQKRDAIHLAVIPAIAGDSLAPGDDVTLDGEVATHGTEDDSIGIVDPFLKGRVPKGERFWLVIYPRVITSLRHVWSHPGIPDEAGCGAPSNQNKAASEAWMRDFLENHDYGSWDDMMQALEWYAKDERDGALCIGVEISGDREIPPEFWRHAEVITGHTFKHHAEFFRCAC